MSPFTSVRGLCHPNPDVVVWRWRKQQLPRQGLQGLSYMLDIGRGEEMTFAINYSNFSLPLSERKLTSERRKRNWRKQATTRKHVNMEVDFFSASSICIDSRSTTTGGICDVAKVLAVNQNELLFSLGVGHFSTPPSPVNFQLPHPNNDVEAFFRKTRKETISLCILGEHTKSSFQLPLYSCIWTTQHKTALRSFSLWGREIPQQLQFSWSDFLIQERLFE